MKKILCDCDNTMGLENRDVDDALAILYLVGSSEVDLAGITTTYGNDTIEVVYETTAGLMKDINRTGIPLVKGGTTENRVSDAACFLAEQAARLPGELTVLATGAMTNLYGAYLVDNLFFHNVREIVLMGGILEPLVIGEITVNELNFSCDPEATYHVLSSPTPTSVMTGHLCLQAVFGAREFDRLHEQKKIPILRYISEKIGHWREFNSKVFKLDGFYNWDVAAALYATYPELFTRREVAVCSTAEDLKTGLLWECAPGEPGYPLNIPDRILDLDAFNDIVFSAWENIAV